MSFCSNLKSSEDRLVKQLIDAILPNVSNLEKLSQLPSSMFKKHVFDPLEQLAKKGDERFKMGEDSSKEIGIIDFLSKGFHSVIHSVANEIANLPPDMIAECSVSEAIFSNADHAKPIVATDSLATCIGIAGYDRSNKQGFVVHFTIEDEVIESGDQIIETLLKLAKNPIESPIEMHLRGGISGLSEPLAKAVEKWILSAKNKGCPMEIVTQQILAASLLDEHGLPNMDSLALDTRDGSVGCYDREKNCYAEPKKEYNEQEVNDLFNQIVRQKKPQIKIIHP